jgi:hypothetical protein
MGGANTVMVRLIAGRSIQLGDKIFSPEDGEFRIDTEIFDDLAGRTPPLVMKVATEPAPDEDEDEDEDGEPEDEPAPDEDEDGVTITASSDISKMDACSKKALRSLKLAGFDTVRSIYEAEVKDLVILHGVGSKKARTLIEEATRIVEK